MKQYLLTIYCRPKNDAKIIINYPNVGALTSAMLEIHWSGDRQTNKELQYDACMLRSKYLRGTGD